MQTSYSIVQKPSLNNVYLKDTSPIPNLHVVDFLIGNLRNKFAQQFLLD